MTTRARFNAEEWATVAQAPMLAGAAVVLAHRGGAVRESMSLARAYADASRERHTELVRELASTPPVIEPAQLQGFGDVTDQAIERVRSGIDTAARVATAEEVADLRGFILALAEKVARAHKEGGVLGIGGQEISEAEERVLERLRMVVEAAA